MRPRTLQTHAWLFAFVDLAFLLLIVVTQIGDTTTAEGLDLGEVVLPRVRPASDRDLSGAARERWQLRVHPRRANSTGPFEMISASDASAAKASERSSLAALRVQLDELRDSGADKPLLAPDRLSVSQDLLDAVSALEERWPSRRRGVTARLASS